MSKTIVLESSIENDAYTEHVYKSYDIQDQNKTLTVIENNLNLKFNFNIGLIIGASGTGKSTLLKSLGEVIEPKFNNAKALVSNFPNLSPEEVTQLLSSVGLGSVPTWLRPYSKLSNGEQARATISKILSEDREFYLLDEFGSTVDADVRKSMANAVGKYAKRSGKKVVIATPHDDVIDWLQPDWVYSTETCSLSRANDFFRPKIELKVQRCNYESWRAFQRFHYLTPDLHKSTARFLITWDEKPVAFLATLDFPNLGTPSKRVTRFVVLPDYQGLGIGKSVLNYIAGLYKKAGYVTYIRVNPALGETLLKDNFWATKKEAKQKNRNNNDKHTKDRKFLNKYILNRPSYSAKYIGEGIKDDLNIVTKKNKELL
jgi:ABC-type lipoprotein export system ATPase subunit/GNAT superfamily N-acetyltransferase